MWQDIREFYAASWKFALAVPILFLIPPLFEFAQHVAEIHIGMYANRAAAKALANNDVRLGFGFAKTVALILPGYWFTRFMAWDDARKAGRPDRPAFALWLILFAAQAALQAFTLFGPSIGALIGLAGQPAQVASAALALVAGIAGMWLTAWGVAWPLGNAACGPIQSVKVMAGSFWRTMGYTLAGVLPLMVVHYALGLGAIGLPAWAYWPMLAIDAVAVGFLACAMAGSAFVAARHAARRNDYPLIPPR